MKSPTFLILANFAIKSDMRQHISRSSLFRLDSTVSIVISEDPSYASLSYLKIHCGKMNPRGMKANVEASTSRVLRDLGGKKETRRTLKGVGGRVTHAQLPALTNSTFFREQIPIVVHKEIEAIKKELWEKARVTPIEYIRA